MFSELARESGGNKVVFERDVMKKLPKQVVDKMYLKKPKAGLRSIPT